MAHQIVPDDSLVPTLRRVVAGDLHYHLFKNNHVPSRATVLGDLTEMVGGSGYAAITVLESDFGMNGVSAHRGYLQAFPIDFIPSAINGDTIYGYYVTDTTDTDLLAVLRFDTPVAWDPSLPITVVPAFGDASRFSS